MSSTVKRRIPFVSIPEHVYYVAKALKPEDQATLFMDCCAYGFEGKEPESEPFSTGWLAFATYVKPVIDKVFPRAKGPRSWLRSWFPFRRV